jgi:Zn-dependent protease
MEIVTKILAYFVLLFAITIHEASHGWAAKKFGDPTAFNMGRVTINPIPHIDPI